MRKGLRPSSRGGRARRAAAEYPPGYDGLPGGAQGLRAWGRCFASGLPQVSPFPQAVSACGRGRRGGLRALASITIRPLLGSTKLATKFATKLEGNFQLLKNNNPVAILAPIHRGREIAVDTGVQLY